MHGLSPKTAIALLCATTMIVGRASAAPYKINDLGTLGGTTTYAGGINANGQVAGSSFTAGQPSEMHPTLYSNGTLVDLGTLGGKNASAFQVNASGQVAGTSETKGDNNQNAHAFLYANGKMNDLGTLGGQYSAASGLNDAGQVVGVADTGVGTLHTHAFLYAGGTMTDLGTLGGYYSAASAINNGGQIVGQASLPYDASRPFEGQHAFLFSQGKMTDLGTLPGSGSSVASSINASGDIVGESGHAFLFRQGKMTDLGTLGGTSSAASAINDQGQVVGNSTLAAASPPPNPAGNLINDWSPRHAFLYSGGRMVDLNTLIPADSGWLLSSAVSINDLGQIVATGDSGDGRSHVLLLTPTAAPEPSSLAVFGVALLSAIVIRRRAPRA